MWEQVTVKQILLITDGCSNIGCNPVYAAETARRNGIAVNVIGIVDGGVCAETPAAITTRIDVIDIF